MKTNLPSAAPDDMKFRPGPAASGARAWILFLALAVFFAVFVFRALLSPDAVLLTTDDNLGFIALQRRALPHGLFRAQWFDETLAGLPGARRPPALTEALLMLLPPRLFANWIHAIDLVLAGIFLCVFLRSLRVGWLPCCLAVACAFWLGGNFTLTYAGHTRKFGTLVFAAAALVCIDRAARAPARLQWAAAAGAAFAFMMLEQPDVGFFFAIFWACYMLFALLARRGLRITELLRVIVPALGMCAVLAGPTLLESRRVNVGEAQSDAGSDPLAKWNFATQWSWPPEESVDFIAPGYTGWRTGEPAGPYWGRMGRSADWEKTRSGFFNFKLENQYLGAIPVFMAVFAVFIAFASRRAPGRDRLLEPELKGEILFWAVAALVSLLLAFGRHFPLYAMFFRLPAVGDIRNPNKFLHIFQIAVAILAAFGLELSLRLGRARGAAGRAAPAAPGADAGRMRGFVYTVLAAGVCLALWAAAGSFTIESDSARLSAMGWGASGGVIASNKAVALWHAALMTLCAGGFFWLLLAARPLRGAIPSAAAAALALVVAADAAWLSRHYVKTMRMSEFKENAAIGVLKQASPERRAAFVTLEGFYNHWLTYFFPYHDIKAFNFTQMPRMPEDYRALLSALWKSAVPLRLWRLSAVGLVLAPAEAWSQIQASPDMQDAFEPVFAYNVVESAGIRDVVPASPAAPGRHVVLAIKQPAPRVALIAGWRPAGDEEALRLLADERFPLFDKVLVAPGHEAGLAPLDGNGMTGAAALAAYRPGRMVIRAETDRPALLRVAEKYDPGWRAAVNGVPAPVLRADFLFQAVYLEPGLSEVVLSYEPSNSGMWLQAAGLLACVAVFAGMAAAKIEHREPR